MSSQFSMHTHWLSLTASQWTEDIPAMAPSHPLQLCFPGTNTLGNSRPVFFLLQTSPHVPVTDLSLRTYALAELLFLSYAFSLMCYQHKLEAGRHIPHSIFPFPILLDICTTLYFWGEPPSPHCFRHRKWGLHTTPCFPTGKRQEAGISHA